MTLLGMSIRTIAVVGGLAENLLTVIDRLPDQGETIASNSSSSYPGGKGATAAVAAYRLSHLKPAGNTRASIAQAYDDIQVVMVGAVGGDRYGPWLVDALKTNGVNIDHVRTIDQERTGTCFVIIEADREDNRTVYNSGANHAMGPADFMTLESLAGGVKPDLLITNLELPRDTVEQIIETAGREGVEVLLNPVPVSAILPKIYRKVTHLVVNETDAAMLSGRHRDDIQSPQGLAQVADWFLKSGVKNVVVTLGDQGVFYSNASEQGRVDPEERSPVTNRICVGCVPSFRATNSW